MAIIRKTTKIVYPNISKELSPSLAKAVKESKTVASIYSKGSGKSAGEIVLTNKIALAQAKNDLASVQSYKNQLKQYKEAKAYWSRMR